MSTIITTLAEQYVSAESALAAATTTATEATYNLCRGIHTARQEGQTLSDLARQTFGIKGAGRDTLAACEVVGIALAQDDAPMLARAAKTQVQRCVNAGVKLADLRDLAKTVKDCEFDKFVTKLTKMADDAEKTKAKAKAEQAEGEESEQAEAEATEATELDRAARKLIDAQQALAAAVKAGLTREHEGALTILMTECMAAMESISRLPLPEAVAV